MKRLIANSLPLITDEELKKIFVPTEQLIEIAIRDFDEELARDLEEPTEGIGSIIVDSIEEFNQENHAVPLDELDKYIEKTQKK